MTTLTKTILLCGLMFAVISISMADTTISDTDKYSWGPNVGWINWQGDVTHGAVISRYSATGFIWSANVGWINLGDGTPAAGLRYINLNGNDFGVNVEPFSDPNYLKLTGFAWGANVGWINFDVEAQVGAANQPRVEIATGKLTGTAWGANIGWLPLESTGIAQVITDINAFGGPVDGWMLR